MPRKKVRGQYNYAAKRFYDAVVALGTGTGSIQERVHDATGYVTSVALREEHIPPSLRERFRELITRMTCAPDPLGEGTNASTPRAMSDEEAAAVAREVVSIFLYVARDYFGPGGAPIAD